MDHTITIHNSVLRKYSALHCGFELANEGASSDKGAGQAAAHGFRQPFYQ
jgi:hypothetical protein